MCVPKTCKNIKKGNGLFRKISALNRVLNTLKVLKRKDKSIFRALSKGVILFFFKKAIYIFFDKKVISLLV